MNRHAKRQEKNQEQQKPVRSIEKCRRFRTTGGSRDTRMVVF